MTTDDKTYRRLRDAVTRAKVELVMDVREDKVPVDVPTFSALHDHVDANTYGGLCDGPPLTGEALVEFGNLLQNELDTWIRNGGLVAMVASWEATE